MSKPEIRKPDYPLTDRDGVAGWFAWVKTPRLDTPGWTYERYHWWRNDAQASPEMKKRYEEITLQKHALQIGEMYLELEELASTYPLQENNKPHDTRRSGKDDGGTDSQIDGAGHTPVET